MTLRFWAAEIGTKNKGFTLSLDKKDRLLDNGSGKALTALPGQTNLYKTKDGAHVQFDAGSIHFYNPGAWNAVKSFKVLGDSADLNGGVLKLSNFVHTDVDLRGDANVTLTIDGAKRGTIKTDDGDDTITIGVTSNGGTWRESFIVNSGDGDDRVLFVGATNKGWASNFTTGATTMTLVNLGAGNDYYDSSTLAAVADVRGGRGDDTILSGSADDELDGGSGNDSLAGNGGGDTLRGGLGSDYLDGGEGRDLLRGGADNDTLLGGGGDDTLLGSEGLDSLDGGDGADSLRGGEDNDTLAGAAGNDTLRGGLGDDLLDGGADHDFLGGGKGNDTLAGGDGDDQLFGRIGDDVLDGGDGADTLTGGLGNDSLTGGADGDIFYFLQGGGEDRVADFTYGEDLLRIDGLLEADLTLSYDGANTVLSFAGGETITVEGVDLVNGSGGTPDTVIYFQGFETDTSGFLFDLGEVTRVASGTNGINAKSGDYYAILDRDSALDPTGPFTTFGVFENAGNLGGPYPGPYYLSAEFYLDIDWASGNGFNYTMETSTLFTSGGFYIPDSIFAFNVAKDSSTGQLLVSSTGLQLSSPVSVYEDLETRDNYATISESGWYRFESNLRDEAGVLVVDMNIYDAAGGLVYSQSYSDPGDLVPQTGGNWFNWLVQIDVDGGLAADDFTYALNDGTPSDPAPTGWYEFV